MSNIEEPEPIGLSPLLVDGPPWEKKHEIGFFVGFIETLKGFLLHPAATFSVMRRNASIGDALVYTVALQVFTFLWMFAVTDTTPEMLLPQDPALLEMLQLPDKFSQIMVLIYPISVILLQFISAYSIHTALKWRNLQTYEFSLIFRVIAYASGTGAVLMIIPIMGGLFSLAMTLYLSYSGLRTIYGLPSGTLVMTALMAVLITIGLYIVLVVSITIVLIILSLII